MSRRYSRSQARFEQPDPYGGSYDLSDPQSFNRYAYVKNDPVNFVDPSGLFELIPCYLVPGCPYSGFDDAWAPYDGSGQRGGGLRNDGGRDGGGGITRGLPSSLHNCKAT